MPPGASGSNTATVQADWANREFVCTVQAGVAQLAAFLNDFGEPAPRCKRALPTADCLLTWELPPDSRARHRVYDSRPAFDARREAEQARTQNGGRGGHVAIGGPGILSVLNAHVGA